jgi:hypothetical protein
MFSASDDRVGYAHGVTRFVGGSDVESVAVTGLSVSSDVTEDGGLVNRRPTGGAAIFMDSANDVTLSGLEFTGYPSLCIHLQDCFHVVIENCTFTGRYYSAYDNVTTMAGFLLSLYGGTDFTIRNCTIDTDNMALIASERSPTDILVEDCTVTARFDPALLSQPYSPAILNTSAPGHGDYRLRRVLFTEPTYIDHPNCAVWTFEDVELQGGIWPENSLRTNVHAIEGTFTVGPNQWAGPAVTKATTLTVPAGADVRVRMPIGLRKRVRFRVTSGTFTSIFDVHGNNFTTAAGGGAWVDIGSDAGWASVHLTLRSNDDVVITPPQTGYEFLIEKTVLRINSTGIDLEVDGDFYLDTSNESGEDQWAVLP